MRKITKECIKAFYNNTPIKRNNTEVVVIENDTFLKLYDHTIAINSPLGLRITTAGYNTRTTRERLNGLREVYLSTKNGNLILNNEPWDGNWKYIN